MIHRRINRIHTVHRKWAATCTSPRAPTQWRHTQGACYLCLCGVLLHLPQGRLAIPQEVGGEGWVLEWRHTQGAYCVWCAECYNTHTHTCTRSLTHSLTHSLTNSLGMPREPRACARTYGHTRAHAHTHTHTRAHTPARAAVAWNASTPKAFHTCGT